MQKEFKNKNIESLIVEEFSRCKDFVVNVMKYKTIEDVGLAIVYYDEIMSKYNVEGWADLENKTVNISVPDISTDEIFYIDYLIGHELGHIIADVMGVDGITEGIAEVVGAYIAHSLSGSKSLKEDIIKTLDAFLANEKYDQEAKDDVIEAKKELAAYDKDDIEEFIKRLITKKQLKETKRE